MDRIKKKVPVRHHHHEEPLQVVTWTFKGEYFFVVFPLFLTADTWYCVVEKSKEEKAENLYAKQKLSCEKSFIGLWKGTLERAVIDYRLS